MTEAIPKDLIPRLLAAKRVLVTGHQNPDGDSLGSMLALTRLLNQNGITAFAAAHRKKLGGPGFLEGVADILSPTAILRKRFDLLITVDCATIDRVPDFILPFTEKLPIVNIDHHVTNTRFGVVNWVCGDVVSVGELIWQLAQKAKWSIDRVVAEALWVSLVTDSGRFAYDATQPGTLRCAADLLTHGVRTAWINDILFCSFGRVAIELKKRAYRSLKIWQSHHVASVTLTKDDFKETGGTKADAEDVIEIPRSIAKNQIALFFYELPGRRKETRVSIRTRAPLDATVLAARFGGGGHIRAAGCTIPESMRRAKQLMRKAVHDLLAAAPKETSH